MIPEYKLNQNSLEPLCEWFHTDPEHIWQVLSDWKENIAICLNQNLENSFIADELEKIQKKNAYIYIFRDSK